MRSSRWAHGLELALVFGGAAACRSAAGPGRAEAARFAEEVVIPKLTPEAGSGVDDGEAGAATTAPAPASTGNGWMMRPDRGSAPTYTDRALVLRTIKTHPHRALLVHDMHVEDCSGVGGTHDFFAAHPPARGYAYYGGPGFRLMRSFEPGELWVAAVEPLAQPTSSKNRAFCIPDVTIDMRVIALVPVASIEEGRRLLETLER